MMTYRLVQKLILAQLILIQVHSLLWTLRLRPNNLNLILLIAPLSPTLKILLSNALLNLTLIVN